MRPKRCCIWRSASATGLVDAAWAGAADALVVVCAASARGSTALAIKVVQIRDFIWISNEGRWILSQLPVLR